jgi:hypothetical protein
MFIDSSDPRNADVLLAFEGKLVGGVKEALVARKEEGGYILQYTGPDGQVTRREGNVAYLGDHRWMDSGLLARRLSEERIRLGVPMPDPNDVQALYASHLESIAMQVRHGDITITNVRMDNEVDRFPLPAGSPAGEWFFQPTGKMSYAVDYDHKDAIEAHARALKQWSEENPDLVPAYVRTKAEGTIKR